MNLKQENIISNHNSLKKKTKKKTSVKGTFAALMLLNLIKKKLETYHASIHHKTYMRYHFGTVLGHFCPQQPTKK